MAETVLLCSSFHTLAATNTLVGRSPTNCVGLGTTASQACVTAEDCSVQVQKGVAHYERVGK